MARCGGWTGGTCLVRVVWLRFFMGNYLTNRHRQWVSAGGYRSNTPFLARRYPRPGRSLCLRYAVGSAGGIRSAILGMEGALVGFLLLGERRSYSTNLFYGF